MADPTHAVLVHKLPCESLGDALTLFPSRHIEKFEYDEVGLRIYFKNYERTREYILRRNIRVQESWYTICPLVTNLTLHGISQYASRLNITDLMAPYGPVIQQYPVTGMKDYRVILGVPEIQTDFKLFPLKLPGLRNDAFCISLFCRLCRQNGHMQLQCSESVHGSVSQREGASQNEHRHKELRSHHGVRSFENSKDKDTCSSSEQHYVQVAKENTSIEMDPLKGKMKPVNSDNMPCNRFGYNQAEINSVHPDRTSRFESQNTDCNELNIQHKYATQNDGLDVKVEDADKESTTVNEVQGEGHVHLGEAITSQPSITAVPSNLIYGCDNSGQGGELSPHKIKPPKTSNLSKESDGKIWSRIIPPKADFKKTQKLLIAVYKTQFLDIPHKVELKLREVLQWNRSRDMKRLKRNDRKFLEWLELYLAAISRERIQSGHPERERRAQNILDDQSSNVEERQKPKRQGAVSLCPGIENIVLKTRGILDPFVLRNFLNQVRGRKNQREFTTTRFEENLHAISDQLEKVEKSYYFYGKRGAKEDRDISFIKRLRERLINPSSRPLKVEANTSKDEQSFCKEHPSLKEKQTSSRRILPQNDRSKPQKNVNYDSQDEDQKSTSKSGNREYPVELLKRSSRKNLPCVVEPSRTPRSNPRSCHAKSSKEKFRTNPQSNSSHDGHCLRRSSTENELQKNLQWIDQNDAAFESQSWRIMNRRKPSVSEDVEVRNSETYFYCNNWSTSNLSDCANNGSVESSAWDVKWDSSDRRSSYITQSSTDVGSLSSRQNLLRSNSPTELSNVSYQSNSAEELPEVTIKDLQNILSSVQQLNSQWFSRDK